MPYSKLYFNKELTELTYTDIESFFHEEREESDKIEFKAYDDTYEKNDKEKENIILRNICALLNSEGGILIWGAPKATIIDEVTKRKIYKGELAPVKKLIEKDNFINRVMDLITPTPRGIQFQTLIKQNNYVYIIDVEKSLYSPHQFKNNYFMRLDGQTVYAPHHYIEALFKKITYPRLEGYLKIENVRRLNYPNDQKNSKFIFQFSLFVFNKSKFQNEIDLNCRVLIDKGNFQNYQFYIGKNKFCPSKQEMIFEPAKSILFYGEPFSHTETIEFPFEEINSNLDFRILFFFGGKTSPMMVSEYLVSLKSIPMGTDNYNSMFQSILENQYLHDKSDDVKLKENEKLTYILGR